MGESQSLRRVARKENEAVKNRNDNMLLRIAQADAYAQAVEYVAPEKHVQLIAESLKFERFLQHPTHHALKPGMYTDDTQMSIAVIEVLLADAKNPFNGLPTPDDFLQRFFEVFKRDERDGYSRGFQKLLETSPSAEVLKARLVPDSRQNGAAMRAVPLGVIRSIKELLTTAEDQAKATHNTPEGISSAQAVAMMSHFALHTDLHFSELPEWGVANGVPLFERFYDDWEGRVVAKKDDPSCPGTGVITAHAVCTLLRNEGSLMSILRKTIEWGGDTDSVASIAWGIASSRYQNEIIPDFLEQQLESGGQYGPTFLKSLGRHLMDAYSTRA